MLVINRYTDESFQVGDNVIITILGVSGGRVKIGIEAPKYVNIRRSELTPLEERRDNANTAE